MCYNSSMKHILCIAMLLGIALAPNAYADTTSAPVEQKEQAAPSTMDAARPSIMNTPESPEQVSPETSNAAERQEPSDKDEPKPDDKLHLHMEGQKGSFTLKPGTVYHWHATPDGGAEGGSKYYKKKLTRDFIPEGNSKPTMEPPVAIEPAADIANTPSQEAAPSTEQQPAAPAQGD